MGASKQGRHGKAAPPPGDLRRAEARIRGAFALLEAPELEELRFAREEGEVVVHLTLKHKVDRGYGPGVEEHLTERHTLNVHLDALLATNEEALAWGFEREVSEGVLAPDLSGSWLLNVAMAITRPREAGYRA